MKKLFLSAILAVLSFNYGIAQVLDNQKIECKYQYSWVPDTTKRNIRVEDHMVLKIGDNYSEFYSYNTFRVDSLIQILKDQRSSKQGSATPPANLGKKGVTYHIFNNYRTAKLIVTDKVVNDNFKYEESSPIKWQIAPDKLNVSGYSAQKASCVFGGRRYIAWFTSDIPVSSGPWKFSGLPGLILKVEDESGDFKFEMSGLRQTGNDSTIQIMSKSYIQTSKEDFQKLTTKYHKDPLKYLNENTGMKVGTGAPIGQSLPYNPIEIL